MEADPLLDPISSRPTAAQPEPQEREYFADRERRNPFFRLVVRLVAPLLTSVTFHFLLLAALTLKTWEYVSRDKPKNDFEAGIALNADLSGGFKWPGEGDLSLVQPETPPTVQIDPAKMTESVSLGDMVKGLRTDASSDDTGGFGVGDAGRSGVLGIGSGAGSGGGGGIGSGFGGGTGIGKANVWNLNAAGNNFAYVVDFSGSITVVQDDLKRELKRSIGALKPPQTFDTFVFYSDPGTDKEKIVTEAFDPALVTADPAGKRRFFNWIDRKAPRGQTEPLAALKRALSLKPDAVFFFSDGFFDDKIVEEITKANASQKTAIFCLVFDEIILSDKSGIPKLTDGARRMQRVAEKNRGKTKVVTGTDLGKK